MAKRRKFSSIDREFVAQRAQGVCEYCQSPQDFVPDTYELEHIVPISLNGTNDLDNIAYACSGCNGRKGINLTAIDPQTGQEVSLFHPRNDVWEEHFEWNQDFSQIIGISPTGRATVDLLLLNRISCVNLRLALIAFGVHPIERL